MAWRKHFGFSVQFGNTKFSIGIERRTLPVQVIQPIDPRRQELIEAFPAQAGESWAGWNRRIDAVAKDLGYV